jgi:tetratricopeptide (TPR) repeat protein
MDSSVIRRRLVAIAVGVCLLALGGAIASARGQETEDRVTTLKRARTLVDEGHPADAVRLLEPLAAGGGPDVRLVLGVALYHADDYRRAIETLSSVAALFPEGSPGQRETEQVLGLSYFLSGRFADAVPLLESARAWAADAAELGYVLGQAYVQTRQPDRARETFARTFGLGPETAAAHLIAAQMMIRLEFESLAEAELAQAVALDSRLPLAHALIGQIALFRGRLDEAVSEFERELALNPGNAMALYQLGDARVRQGRWDEGIEALQKSIWLNPYYSAPYIVLGKAYLQKDQPSTAEGMLTRAIQYDPNNRSAHYLLGQVLQRLGRSDDAKREFAIAERLQEQAGR